MPKVTKPDRGRAMTGIRQPGPYSFAKRGCLSPQSKLRRSLMDKACKAASLTSKLK